MEFQKEAALVLARVGKDRDQELQQGIEMALIRAFNAGRHKLELKIATWGDISPGNKAYILGDD